MKEKKIITNKEQKINQLFDRTADEIFYDFFKKYFKIIMGILFTLILGILYSTYIYQSNMEYEERITEKIIATFHSGDEGKNHKIQEIIKGEKGIKEHHKVILLLMKNNNKNEELNGLYGEAKNIKYVCQYPFTSYHFDDLSFSIEFFYLEVLYLLGKNGRIREMEEFFMAKKMQCSIFSFYGHLILALYSKDKHILHELFVGHSSFLTNINKTLVLYMENN